MKYPNVSNERARRTDRAASRDPSVMGIVNVDARLVLRRRRPPASRPPPRQRAGACWTRARPFSTSAVSRRAPAPTESRSTSSSAASCRCSRRCTARRSRSTRRRPRSLAARSSSGRRWSTTSPRCAATPRWPASSGTAAPTSVSCTCRASRGRCRRARCTTTSFPRSPRSSRSGSRHATGAGVPRSASPRPGDRVRQDGRSELRARASARRARRTRPAGPRRLLAQELARAHPRHEGATTGPLSASLAAAVAAYERGATIIRAHDVREHVEALTVATVVAG